MSKDVIANDIHGNTHIVAVGSLRWRPSAYAVVVKDEKVLLVPAFSGYSLPGGGLELGESIEVALMRETKEETGITVRNPKLLGVESNLFILPGKSEKGNNVQSIMLFYACEYVGGELTDEGFDENEKEFGGFPEWVPIASLPTITVTSSVDWRKYIQP